MGWIMIRTIALAVSMAAAGLSAQTTVVASGSAAKSDSIDSTWWKHAVIYEIYPRSFQDSNGDGIGDLNGITQRLDYLQALGVDAIWISPMYPSPQVDFGYDISDYENVDPQYGTLQDFDRLVAEAKKRNIRVVLDMVLNHTSDKHKWFIESASSRTNAKRDWYVWSDGKNGGKDGGKPGANGKPVPPNNWVSLFGGSAWEYMPQTKSFYYHKFYKQQPDLNWRNPAVEKAMFGSMQFWLNRGVAGYRLDAIPTLFEDPQMRDEPETGGTNAQGDPNLKDIYTDNLPEVHDVIRRMRAMVAKYPGDRVLIGETYLPNTAELDKWYGGAKKDELQLPMDMIVGFSNKLDAGMFRTRISEVETQVHGSQPLLVFDNHDNIRSWERYGDGEHNVAIAKLIATMLFTTRATALMYYGEELGMVTSTPARVEQVKDPIGITGWPKEKGRDGERTPMQWNASAPQAGFSTSATTWLPVASNYKTVNVETELKDPNSLLNWHKTLIEMRRKRDAVRDGGMVMLDGTNPSVLAYVRTAPAGHHNIVVALNMTAQPQKIVLDLKEAGIQQTAVRTLLTNDSSLQGATTTSMTLPPFASWIGEVQMQ
jgi:alpha-glucosidase